MKNFDIFIEYSIVNSWCRQIKCGVKLTYNIYGASHAVISKNGCTVLFVCVLSSQKLVTLLMCEHITGLYKKTGVNSGPRLLYARTILCKVYVGLVNFRTTDSGFVEKCGARGRYQSYSRVIQRW